jgi:BMFP domain-containing protein YqiC
MTGGNPLEQDPHTTPMMMATKVISSSEESNCAVRALSGDWLEAADLVNRRQRDSPGLPQLGARFALID